VPNIAFLNENFWIRRISDSPKFK